MKNNEDKFLRKSEELKELLARSKEEKKQMKDMYESRITAYEAEAKRQLEEIRRLKISLAGYEGTDLGPAAPVLMEGFQKSYPERILDYAREESEGIAELVKREVLSALNERYLKSAEGSRRREALELVLRFQDYLAEKESCSLSSLFVPSALSFYPEELKNLILDELYKAADTRKVLVGLLEASDFSFEQEYRRERFVCDMHKVKNVDTCESVMASYGFEKVSKNGHPKFVYYGNPRFTVTGSNSPGDYRTMDNLLHDIMKLCM